MNLTVKELAEVINASERTIYNHKKDLECRYSLDLMVKQGKQAKVFTTDGLALMVASVKGCELPTPENLETWIAKESRRLVESLPTVTCESEEVIEAAIVPVEVVGCESESLAMGRSGLTRFQASTVNLDLSAAYQGLQDQRDYLSEARAQVQAAKEEMWRQEAEAEALRKQQIQQEVQTRMDMEELRRQNAELMATLKNVAGV